MKPSDSDANASGGSCGHHCGCSGIPSDEAQNPERRDFLALTAGAMAGVSAAVVAWPMVQSMNPAADVLAMSTKDIDLTGIQPGQSKTDSWLGKPVFVRNRTQAEIDEARAVPMNDLKDPQTDQDRVKQSVFNGQQMPNWLILVGVCTHLGCIPLGQKPTDPHGEFDGWFCPCHGSQYDSSGRIRKGPAPKNLVVPPYTFTSATRITIGVSSDKAKSNG